MVQRRVRDGLFGDNAEPEFDIWRAFDAFWTVYPRKEGKLAAKAIWSRMKPTAELFRQIMTALAWQVMLPKWKEKDGEFIPQPKTYLRQGRWLDECRLTPRSEHWSQSCEHLPKCEKWIWHEMRLEKEKLSR